MLSKKVIRELRSEAIRFRRQADRIDEFLEELGNENGSPAGANGSNIEDSLSLAVPSDPLNESFSDKIRSALRDIGHTASSRDVADRMIELGDSPPERNGKPLRQVIAVELFRMSKRETGGVRKIERGRYKMMK